MAKKLKNRNERINILCSIWASLLVAIIILSAQAVGPNLKSFFPGLTDYMALNLTVIILLLFLVLATFALKTLGVSFDIRD